MNIIGALYDECICSCMETISGETNCEKYWNAFGKSEKLQNKLEDLLDDQGKHLLSQILDAEEIMRLEGSKEGFINGWVLASWIMLDTFSKPQGTVV